MTTLDESVRAEIKSLRVSGELEFDGVNRTAPRCHVCCEIESRDLVNKLLAAGLTTREIVDACRFINDRREVKGDLRLIEMHNVRHHRSEHFNLTQPVQAAYRAIYDRRAAEANRDVEEGTGTAVTPYAAMETTMVKGYGKLTDEETTVTVPEMLAAAKLLHELTSKDQGQKRMADLLHTMDKFISAAQEFIDPSQHDAFLARVNGQPGPKAAIVVHPTAIESSVRDFTPDTATADDEEI